MFDSLQHDSTKSAPQYELNSFVTMDTYWVPGLPNIKEISGHLWHCILIFANGASYASSSEHINMLAQVSGLGLMFCELKITNILKSSRRGLEKSELPWKWIFL